MGNRLTQIATRTGDDGTTGLGDNTRVAKDSLRVHAMGEIDELNSHIGVLLCESMPDVVRTLHKAAERWGYPMSFLTDNGAIFTATAVSSSAKRVQNWYGSARPPTQPAR